MLLTMGNREDLIAGAKRCLIEKGYAHTTARDIAAASGVSLAAIGYHFGSKDALMNQAVYESVGEWADEVPARPGRPGRTGRGAAASASNRSWDRRLSPSAARGTGSGPRSWNS